MPIVTLSTICMPDCGGPIIAAFFESLELLTGAGLHGANPSETRNVAPGGEFFECGRLSIGEGMTIDDRMADLRHRSAPPDQAAVQQYSGADAGRDRQKDNVSGISPGAEVRLPDRGEIRIIGDGYSPAEPGSQVILGELG